MGTALLAARLLLAAVFATAGAAKLMDRSGSRWALEDFGLPSRFVPAAAIALPLAELAVAVALIVPETAFWGAVGALALLLLFVAWISFNLARGHRPECHCFGQIASAPAGPKTLARNGLLAAVAGFILVEGADDAGPSIFGWVGSLTALELTGIVVGVILLALLAAQGLALTNLVRQNGRLLLRLSDIEQVLVDAELMEPLDEPEEKGLPVGTSAPAFSLSSNGGEPSTLDSLRAAEKPVVLVFSAPDCAPCAALLPAIGRWQGEHSDEMTVALVSSGTSEANGAKSAEHGVEHVLLDDGGVADAYGVEGTPSAVIVGPEGAIQSPLAEGPDEIRALVENLMNTPWRALAVPVGRPIGEPAPEIELPDLAGETARSADFAGGDTLVLFWHPGCMFCQRMLDDLKAWEADPPKRAPNLLIVSGGTVAENEALGLRSRIVLDEEFDTGWSFGASGTPAGVLVDASGKVASEVASGAPDVLALAGVRARGRELSLD